MGMVRPGCADEWRRQCATCCSLYESRTFFIMSRYAVSVLSRSMSCQRNTPSTCRIKLDIKAGAVKTLVLLYRITKGVFIRRSIVLPECASRGNTARRYIGMNAGRLRPASRKSGVRLVSRNRAQRANRSHRHDDWCLLVVYAACCDARGFSITQMLPCYRTLAQSGARCRI